MSYARRMPDKSLRHILRHSTSVQQGDGGVSERMENQIVLSMTGEPPAALVLSR